MIYITGATGFIGSRVAARLLAQGERIRCLVRSRTKAAALTAAGAELIEGDLTDSEVHERGMAGASGAIHLAAIYDIGIVDRAALWRTNVDGTRAFLDALRRAQQIKGVFISSTVALGPSNRGEPSEAYSGPYHSAYHHSKAESHRLARAAQSEGIPLVIVCPSFVYGPGDEGPAGRLINDLRGRKLPALLSRPSVFSYVYVDDVADGIVAALARGKPGLVYTLSGEEATLTEYARRVCALAGVKPPPLTFPVGVARTLGKVLDPIARLTGIRFPISSEAVSTTTVDPWRHTHTRATNDFGYNPRGLTDGLRSTLGDE